MFFNSGVCDFDIFDIFPCDVKNDDLFTLLKKSRISFDGYSCGALKVFCRSSYFFLGS